MKTHSLEATELCLCGSAIGMVGSSCFIQTGQIRVGAKTPGHIAEKISAECSGCGLVYNHLHSRFSRYYNEIKDKISR